MSVTGAAENAPAARERVRDLLLRCAASTDLAQRSLLLARIADELDQAAREIAAANPATTREMVAVLRGQADMARFVAAVERRDPEHRVG